jgi:CheY-like chemotaxis protein
MAPDILRRVFDPFFTTKGVRQGTGLGLTVSHNIIASLDGVIEVESQPGHGAVFRVVLPPAKTTSQPVSPPAAPRATTHRGHILVIDDDAAVARAIHGILQSEHDVSSLVSARAAVEHLEAGHEYDLVLCDLMMPEVTGMALYARLKAHSPAQASKLVFITGGAFTSEAERFLEESGCTYLSKAITPHELRAFARDFIMGTPTAPSP